MDKKEFIQRVVLALIQSKPDSMFDITGFDTDKDVEDMTDEQIRYAEGTLSYAEMLWDRLSETSARLGKGWW